MYSCILVIYHILMFLQFPQTFSVLRGLFSCFQVTLYIKRCMLHALFITVSFKPLSVQLCGKYRLFSSLEHVFILTIFTIVLKGRRMDAFSCILDDTVVNPSCQFLISKEFGSARDGHFQEIKTLVVLSYGRNSE